jgi:NTP pyrophosphatase (non-canonical NTP hydrolase)
MDDQTTIAELRSVVQKFVDDRNWAEYHTPKNLSMSIAIEAAEILEHFQWRTAEESICLLEDNEAYAEIIDELADVLIYCLSFANQADIDLSRAICAKLDRNEDRFPVGYMPT